jgi:hypothetical protein
MFSAKAVSTEFNTYMGKLYSACGKTLEGSCAGGKALRFKAKVANLKEVWMKAASDNSALVSEYAGGDVSERFGEGCVQESLRQQPPRGQDIV